MATELTERPRRSTTPGDVSEIETVFAELGAPPQPPPPPARTEPAPIEPALPKPELPKPVLRHLAPPVGQSVRPAVRPAGRAPAGHRSDSDSPWWTDPRGVIGALLIAGGLLGYIFSSTDTGSRTKPIGEVQLGERVVAQNPTGEFDETLGLDVNPATWRQIVLQADKRGGGHCRIELLRPQWWLNQNRAAVGGRVHIAIPECGVNDQALVLSIGPCPPIRPGDGPVVTGKFTHDAADVVDVHVEGLERPIGTTPNHRFWSVDRQEFVRADKLAPGERLSARGETVRFLRMAKRPRPERVYNLEVQGEHVYRVAGLGILVHNTTPPGCPNLGDELGRGAEGIVYESADDAEQVVKVFHPGGTSPLQARNEFDNLNTARQIAPDNVVGAVPPADARQGFLVKERVHELPRPDDDAARDALEQQLSGTVQDAAGNLMYGYTASNPTPRWILIE